ncbi:MAG: DUF1801 domain-containing protein [Candidatus Nitrotoga sp.]
MTKSSATKNSQPSESKSEGVEAITQYNLALTAEHAAICDALRNEIDATLSTSTCKIWYANPVWFIGADPIVGYNITAKKTVNLLFWSGQLFDEPELKASGKFKAAQIQFKHESEIDVKALRGWLKKSANHIFDYNGMRKGELGK